MRINSYRLVWAPEGREIALVDAVSKRAAISSAPMPHRRYKGEIYAELVSAPPSYIVRYTASRLGKQQSSRWALKSDAENYAATVRELGRIEVSVIESDLSPEILPHCPDSESQAIGGLCFKCKTKLTTQHAAKWNPVTQRVEE